MEVEGKEVNKSIKKKDLLVTYAMASADRFKPIPELDDDEVEFVILNCCCNGFFRGKRSTLFTNKRGNVKDVQPQVGSGNLLLKMFDAFLVHLHSTMIPSDLGSGSGSGSGFVVAPYVVDAFVELEMSNSN